MPSLQTHALLPFFTAFRPLCMRLEGERHSVPESRFRHRRKLLSCAIYTRKSTEHNLDLEFNSLDAQREACEAYDAILPAIWRMAGRRPKASGQMSTPG
jgi:hypothetical protein